MLPEISSRIVYPLPAKSSHQVRCRLNWSGAGSASPRRFSTRRIVLAVRIG
jgi:hypothetical protein